MLGIPTVLSLGPWSSVNLFGYNIFGFVDYVSANIFLVISGLAMALFVGWSLGIKNFMAMANQGAKGVLVKPFWGVLIKYMIPAIIIILFLARIL